MEARRHHERGPAEVWWCGGAVEVMQAMETGNGGSRGARDDTANGEALEQRSGRHGGAAAKQRQKGATTAGSRRLRQGKKARAPWFWVTGPLLVAREAGRQKEKEMGIERGGGGIERWRRWREDEGEMEIDGSEEEVGLGLGLDRSLTCWEAQLASWASLFSLPLIF